LIRAILSLALVTLLAASDAHAWPDSITFGNAASEKAHAFAGEKTVTATGGLDQSCRRIEPGGALVFDLACDPDAQNYLTVKFWGSDTDPGILLLYNKDRRLGEYLTSRPELDLSKGEAALPGRFYYATCLLPPEMTRGKRTVTVKLAAIGGVNPYAEAGKRESPFKKPTRGIYVAYCHTDAYFEPPADARQGAVPPLQDRPPVAPADLPAIAASSAGATLAAAAGSASAGVIARLHKEADDRIAQLLKWQLYGPEWDAAVAKGDAPALVTGAIIHPSNWKSLATEGWQDAVARRTTDGNAMAVSALAIYAKAYQSKWSRYGGNKEMLDRVARGLDFYTAAQGASGGYFGKGWVGGPDRKPAGSCLEGFGTVGLGMSLVLVGKDLAAARMLDTPIDHDGDPRTPPVSRRRAWAEMLARHRDFLTSPAGRGHATNQDLAQMNAMWAANEALRLLAPDMAWPREKALPFAYAAAGLAPDVLGGRWVTRKGLALEPWGTLGGGYCGNYGLMGIDELSRLAEQAGDPKLNARAVAAVGAGAYFLYPSTDAEGFRCMRREEVISSRNNSWPGRVDYGGNAFVAAALKDPVAAREVQLALAQCRPRTILPEGNAHFLASLFDAMMDMESYEAAVALAPSASRLPMEDGQPDFAWADEEGQIVAVEHNGSRLYVSLNWRRGFKDNKRDAEHAWTNGIARVHFTTPWDDHIATIAMESPHGFGKLYVCRYGMYLVGMNASADATFDVAIPADVGRTVAVDLVTGRAFNAPAVVKVLPSTTVVLYLGNEK